MTQMDADERHEDLTGMDRIYRIYRIRNWVGSAVSADRLYAFRLWQPTFRRWITPGGPPAASKGKQLFVCMGNPDSSGFPLATLLPNFELTDKMSEVLQCIAEYFKHLDLETY